MKTLKKKNSNGYDRVPMYLIADLWPTIRSITSSLFKKIENQNYIPQKWKIGRIIPLHKKGEKDNGTNYRPITNLCTLAKVFEKTIQSHLNNLQSLTGVNLFTDNQHGFTKNKSTISASMSIKRKIVKALDQNNVAALISLDLSAAFDVVNHDLLIKRLTIMGIPDSLVRL